MTISFSLPPDVEQALRRSTDDVAATAREACLVELFRQRKISQFQLGEALGVSRFEIDEVLKKHEIFLDLTAEEVIRESEGIQELRENNARRR
ncbi:MAG: UPF0175 family protein [Phycisphaerales bacterium]|nr:UPF0175 family protein [Phycisphaerales bacterium]